MPARALAGKPCRRRLYADAAERSLARGEATCGRRAGIKPAPTNLSRTLRPADPLRKSYPQPVGADRAAMKKFIPFVLFILLVAASQIHAQALNVGLGVGQKVPPFRLTSQFGTVQDLNAVRGPKGTALLFFRSADW